VARRLGVFHHPAAVTCGPAGNNQFLGQTSLPPGQACVSRCNSGADDPINRAKSATVSVSDAAGTQTSALTGNANP